MGSQGLLRLGQKRGNDHLVDHTSASEVITRRRLETDQKFPSRPLPSGPHLASICQWGSSSSSTPVITQMGLGFGSDHHGGAAAELPLLNQSLGIPSLAKYSRPVRFAEMDARVSSNVSETRRLLDSLNSKAMHSSSYGAFTNPRDTISVGENGFKESDFNRQQLLSLYGRGAESMRRALGKDINRSGEDTTRRTAVNKFTLMGEQVDKSTETASSSEGLQEMLAPASRLSTNPRGIFPISPYFYETGSDKAIPTYPNSTLSRGFYRSSFADRFNSSSMLFGRNTIHDPSANVHASVGLKMGRHSTGSSTLRSFEATNAAMQEAMCNNGKSPAEVGTSRSVLKSVTLRKKDKDSSNIFPANVKSLLSTGIFDGVSVKYVSWDRTKNVRGTIQGTGYLCWCKDCQKKKMVNAYQLEQHAGSKSKHPNDHIYFSNGKSIYGVVQELKNTPSDKLLEVIPTVTGSGINNQNFFKWKESFQAAGRELQRIFGSDPVTGDASSSKNAVVPC